MNVNFGIGATGAASGVAAFVATVNAGGTPTDGYFAMVFATTIVTIILFLLVIRPITVTKEGDD